MTNIELPYFQNIYFGENVGEDDASTWWVHVDKDIFTGNHKTKKIALCEKWSISEFLASSNEYFIIRNLNGCGGKGCWKILWKLIIGEVEIKRGAKDWKIQNIVFRGTTSKLFFP